MNAKTKLTGEEKAELVKLAQKAAESPDDAWEKLGAYFREHPSKELVEPRPVRRTK